MEQNPSTPEEVLALEISTQADIVLQDTDNIQLTQRYTCSLGEGYNLELRVQGGNGQNYLDRLSTRYLYVYQHAEVCRGVVFSLDLNSFEREQGLSGIVADPYHLASAAEAIEPAQTQEKEIILEVLKIMQKHDAIGGVNEDELATLGQLYFDLIDQGATMIFKQDTLKVDGEFNIWVSGTELSGPGEHQWPYVTLRPHLLVAVTPENDSMQTVFERSHDGALESYVQLANTLERMAAYANEEDISRDEEGKVIGLFGNTFREDVVVEAERATGVRDLEITQLEFIRHSLQQALQT